MIPYDTCDMEWQACQKLAAELRASGQYSRVEVRRRQPEDGREYGRIYVQRVEDQ